MLCKTLGNFRIQSQLVHVMKDSRPHSLKNKGQFSGHVQAKLFKCFILSKLIKILLKQIARAL